MTTATLLTPSGMGAVAVVRVCGPKAQSIVTTMFRPARAGACPLAETRRLCYGQLFDDDERIDDVIVSRQSIGGGDIDVVDINAHGGVRIAERVLLALERRGAVVRSTDEAGPDMCWWPASNRVDVEIDRALVQARTRRAVRFIASQRTRLPAALKELADRTRYDADAARQGLSDLVRRWTARRYLVHGAEVALVGPPNAGKSTLANRLVGQERTLTSEQPGTTRDWTAHDIAMHGVPITLIDTAGLQDAKDPLDDAGVRRGVGRAAATDLRVLVLDRSTVPPPDVTARVEGWNTPRHLIVAVNKADQPPAWRPEAMDFLRRFTVVTLSATTGEGVSGLVDAVVAALGLDTAEDDGPCLVSDAQAADVASLLASHDPAGLAKGARRLVE